jgi:hypothetical protein
MAEEELRRPAYFAGMSVLYKRIVALAGVTITDIVSKNSTLIWRINILVTRKTCTKN